MKVVVLCQDYPSEGHPYAMAYVHTRCREYMKHGVNVVVLNYSATQPYIYEGVSVSTAQATDIGAFDTIISHAPNLKNHIRQLASVKNKKIVMFFHGHEVLRTYGDYPPPYDWNRPGVMKMAAQKVYDALKLKIMPRAIRRIASYNAVKFIFVSNWMLHAFNRNMGLDAASLGSVSVIPNASNSIFMEKKYDISDYREKIDFVTIRPFDDAKYAMDLVIHFADRNPDKIFHIYGRGRFFLNVAAPVNVTVHDTFLPQSDIPTVLDRYKVAVMPTRYDAQGVMMCEMASYGIPLITTDVPICREMLTGFSRVRFLTDIEFNSSAAGYIMPPTEADVIPNRFSPQDLIRREMDAIHES